MNRLTKTVSISLLVFMVAVFLGPSGTAWAKHRHSVRTAAGPDPTAVSACGTLSANNTIYYLTANLTETGDGTCITLSGSNSALLLYGWNITGPDTSSSKPSTGYGIEITGTMDVVEGFDAIISGFLAGIYDNGTQILGDDVEFTGNVTGLLVGSSGHTHDWSNLGAYSNFGNGIWFDGCVDDCFVSDFATYENALDGLLVQGTNGFNASVFVAIKNGSNGVEMGGTDDESNTDAHLVDAFLTDIPYLYNDDAVGGNTENGILLDSGETDDQVSTVYAAGNGNGTTSFDLYDENTTCGTDLWYNNTFTTSRAGSTSSPTCIHGMGD